MSKIYTIQIIDLYDECTDFLYDMRSVLKHNEGLYVKDVIDEEKVHCKECKYNNDNKCMEFDEIIDLNSNVCYSYIERS